MNKNINVLRKSLALSYIYSKLTLENLEAAVHEMQLIKSKDAKRLKGYFNKLIEANQNAYQTIERNVSQEEVQALRDDLDKLMDVSWEEQSNG
jgi:hypothetical protein